MAQGNFVPASYWQQKVDYNIKVQLDDILHSLDGYEEIAYTNHSPDTLHFIWFHLWPNAYKNDRTAFSEQLLKNDRTDFYFSKEENRGYISNLSFKVNNIKADTQQHQQYIDVVKLMLKEPLFPGQSINIATSFHVKLPYNFSRSGHVKQNYQITQWYPKPAVYDNKGWHPMPYLDQGEFYSEFGNYDVQITLPQNYIVAASGILQTEAEKTKLLGIAALEPIKQENYIYYNKKRDNKFTTVVKSTSAAKNKNFKTKESIAPKSAATLKTLHYQLNNAHDFAWFASKQFLVQHDTVQLENKSVDVFAYYPPWQYENWKTSIAYAKNGLKFYDKHVGNYPYSTASVLSGPQTIGSGGMEYPSITLITTQGGGQELDAVIAHELGHNWFYGSLASNERAHAWMDEGMNSFYEKKYTAEKYPPAKKGGISTEESIEKSVIKNLENIGKDQPIDLPADSFTMVNYGLFVYEKTAVWMQQLEQQLGKPLFEKSMKNYYAQWQFKHPYPENFKQSIQTASNQPLDSLYTQLFTTAAQRTPPPAVNKPYRLAAFFPFKNTDKYRFISLSPMIGYNAYDNLMIGGMIHNYELPLSKFNFLAIPLYGTQTSRLNYYARVAYKIPVKKGFLDNININSSFSSFSYKHIDFNDSLFPAHYNVQFFKIDPTIRFNIRNKYLASSVKKLIQLKTFFIGEQDYNSKSVKGYDSSFIQRTNRNLVQLKLRLEDFKALYPYNVDLTIDANKDFARAGLTANYFFNYASEQQDGKGLNVRFFAGKFFHIGSQYQYETARYFLNLTGPRGNEDYTYSNYFIGRGDFEGANSQQLMERDGFFKVGKELQGQVGKTDKWLSAVNFTGDIPKFVQRLFPDAVIRHFPLPFKFFVDIGTYAEAWDPTVNTPRFLYDAGIQISLLKYVNIYLPLMYSQVYRDYYNSVFPGKSFGKSISFSIDIQNIQLNKLVKNVPL
ncbi:M1 family metallopeptidase [Parasediminibacterium sp. JCM 36343]|uniref:M1 family metallopeptidase n=1 Tax=Parasediminibacterium sp. JCM 36343 TaxID=3374279 RepID=UPI00397E35BC